MNRLKKIILAAMVCIPVLLFSFKFDDRYFEIAKNLDVFATLFKDVNTLYVDDVNPNKMMRTGIEAMLAELDPYTNFYPEDDIEDYRTMHAGKYNGIGATVTLRNGFQTVTMIYENSPADKAGIKIGDIVMKINNVAVSGRSNDELGRLLKGQTGTDVNLEIQRYQENKPIKLSVKRAVVETPNVPHYGMINEEVGYIQLKDFSATAAAEIKSAYDAMKALGLKKLILDLRGNPGGLLQQSVEICNFFIPKGDLVVETKGKMTSWNKKYTTLKNPIDLEIPLVVLINSTSASASEIVSGTLQDYDRAVVIGQKSFGKGLVQVTRPLSYNTQLKVTTAKYYIPSGRCIQALDYSHRNEDGSVGKVPDSLKSTFYTKNKRMVKDGGGVDPDILVTAGSQSDLTKQLLKQGLIFDFSTAYYFDNKSAIPQGKFVVSDELYNRFVDFVKSSSFNYSDDAGVALNELEFLAASDNAYSDLLPALQNLRGMVNRKNAGDFERYKSEIKEELALEILSRYHYDKVMKFVSFEKDEEVQEALSLFKDMPKYRRILQGK
jgi:carboxyl-terminal processing protease